MSRLIDGTTHVFGDRIDTDALAPGAWMKAPIEEMAKHCLEAVDPGFAARVRDGDVLVAGAFFGVGSSREQAVAALLTLGVRAVIAVSFARIFYRNAINLGLPVMACATARAIPAGARLRVDPTTGAAVETDSGRTHVCEPSPPHLMRMIADGGLLPHLERRLSLRQEIAS
jgi:3-isopropylmalate/(R)-2-methylmalate dehydratase small subunit